MRVEIRHLELVCAIADHGSLNKAASAVGLAPSALTTQLQRIERSLGGSLFERDRRGARPTPLGDLVLRRARCLIPALDDLNDAAMSFASESVAAAVRRIGAARGSPLLAGLLRRLADAAPELQVTIQQSSSAAALADMVSTGRIDEAVIGLCGDASPPGGHDVVWCDVAMDAVFVLMAADHRLASRPEVELSELADESWAAAGPYESCFEECFAAACARAGFAVRNMYELDGRTAIDLTAAGQVVTLCQSSFVPPPGLCSVPIAGTPLTWRHAVGWRADRPADQVDQLLCYTVEAYLERIDRIPNRGEWLARQPHLGARIPGRIVRPERGAERARA